MVTHFAEDRRIEYKATPKIHWDDIATYYSAFSNTPEGGVLCFDVANDGTTIGCTNLSTKQLNRIEHFHVQMCRQAKPEIKRIPVTVSDREDFLILVYLPYMGKLVETNKSDAWIRYGDTKHKMSEEEKRDYRSTRNEFSYELEQAPFSFPDDFDLKIVADLCDSFREREMQYDWTDEEILVDRYLVERDGDRLAPLNSLVLLAAKSPRKTIPGCRVRVQRFEGTEEGSGQTYTPIRDVFAEGNLVEIISRSSAAIENTLHTVTWLNRDGKFVTTPEYPRWAWFESLVNACVHRSYSFTGTEITVKVFSDRMEIESPGGFVPPVNERTIYHTRAARNAHLMDAMRYLGYVQMAREGTRRIRDSMMEYGLPAPKFSQEVVNGVVVRVCLLNDSEIRKRTTDRDVASHFGVKIWKSFEEHEVNIAAYVFRNKTIQVSEAQRLTGRTWQTSKKDLDRLCRKNVLRFISGKFPRDPKAHYVLYENEDGEEAQNGLN